MKKSGFLIGAGILFLILSSPLVLAGYEYPGKWKVLDKNKNEYNILLDLGGNAQSTLGKGQMGAWTLAGEGVRILWTDGTSEIIQRTKEGYIKVSAGDHSVVPAEKVR